MALTNGKFTNGPLIFLSTRSNKVVDGEEVEVDPHFEISRVGEDGKIARTAETATEISGDLSKIDFKEREYNEKTTKHVVLFIRDGADTYHLDLTYRLSTRSLFNSLLSLANPKGIEIGIYRNKKGFETFSVRQGGEMVKWKHELDAQPKGYKMLNKKGELVKTDYSEVDEFFEAELRALIETLFGPQAAKADKPATAAPAATPAAKTTATASKAKAAAPAAAPAPAAVADDTSVPF
jgi:hypothetical protein